MTNHSISAHHQAWIDGTTKSIDSAKDAAKQAIFDNLDLASLVEDPQTHLSQLKMAILSSIFPHYKDSMDLSEEFGKQKAAAYHAKHG